MTVERNSIVTVPTALAKPGYVFKGWRVTRSHVFDRTIYQPGDEYKAPSGQVITVMNAGIQKNDRVAVLEAWWESDKQFVPTQGEFIVHRDKYIRREWNEITALDTPTMTWTTSNENILKIDPETGQISPDSFSFARIGRVTIIGTEHDTDEPYERYRLNARVAWGNPEWLTWLMVIFLFGWAYL